MHEDMQDALDFLARARQALKAMDDYLRDVELINYRFTHPFGQDLAVCAETNS